MAAKFSATSAVALGFLVFVGCATNDSPGGTLPGDRPTRIETEAGEASADGQAQNDAAVDRFDSSVFDAGTDTGADAGNDF